MTTDIIPPDELKEFIRKTADEAAARALGPVRQEQIRHMLHEELDTVLTKASEAGARRALSMVGLHDENAAKDVLELRNLMGSWRAVRADARKSIVSVLTKILLALIMAGVAAKTGIVSFNFPR